MKAKDIFDQTPLSWAAFGGFPNIIRALIAAGADLKGNSRILGNALMAAAKKDHPEVISMLLSLGDVGACDPISKKITLLWALKNSHSDITKILIIGIIIIGI